MAINTKNASRELIRAALFLMKNPTVEDSLVAWRLTSLATHIDGDTIKTVAFVELCVAFSKSRHLWKDGLVQSVTREMRELLKETP